MRKKDVAIGAAFDALSESYGIRGGTYSIKEKIEIMRRCYKLKWAEVELFKPLEEINERIKKDADEMADIIRKLQRRVE